MHQFFLLFEISFISFLSALLTHIISEAKQVEKLVEEYDSIAKEKEAFTKECKEKVKNYRYKNRT